MVNRYEGPNKFCALIVCGIEPSKIINLFAVYGVANLICFLFGSLSYRVDPFDIVNRLLDIRS